MRGYSAVEVTVAFVLSRSASGNYGGEIGTRKFFGQFLWMSMRVAVDGLSSAAACCCYSERLEHSTGKPMCSSTESSIGKVSEWR